MQDSLGRRMAIGFGAAVLSVLLVHQGIVWLLTLAGVIKGAAWSLAPIKPFGIPTLMNSMFWGGLWGAVFGLVHDKLPGGEIWIKGLIFGLLIVFFSNWLGLPLIKMALGQSGQVLFAGFDLQRMLAGIAVLGGFGAALGILYNLLAGRIGTTA